MAQEESNGKHQLIIAGRARREAIPPSLELSDGGCESRKGGLIDWGSFDTRGALSCWHCLRQKKMIRSEFPLLLLQSRVRSRAGAADFMS